MTQFTITKTTKTAVTALVTYKTGKEVKHVIKNRQTFMDTICYILDNKEIIRLLKACETVLDVNTIKDVKKLYAPTKAQKAKSAASREVRQNWYGQNEKQLNKEIEKMVNHPGFMGHGITRKEIDSTVSKEVQKLYNLV